MPEPREEPSGASRGDLFAITPLQGIACIVTAFALAGLQWAGWL